MGQSVDWPLPAPLSAEEDKSTAPLKDKALAGVGGAVEDRPVEVVCQASRGQRPSHRRMTSVGRQGEGNVMDTTTPAGSHPIANQARGDREPVSACQSTSLEETGHQAFDILGFFSKKLTLFASILALRNISLLGRVKRVEMYLVS